MRVEKQAIRQAIDEYMARDPSGEHVTAYVFDRIGEEDFRSYARAAHRNNIDPAKQEIGALVKLLIEKFDSVKQLDSLRTDSERWPGLAGWLKNYTTYRTG